MERFNGIAFRYDISFGSHLRSGPVSFCHLRLFFSRNGKSQKRVSEFGRTNLAADAQNGSCFIGASRRGQQNVLPAERVVEGALMTSMENLRSSRDRFSDRDPGDGSAEMRAPC